MNMAASKKTKAAAPREVKRDGQMVRRRWWRTASAAAFKGLICFNSSVSVFSFEIKKKKKSAFTLTDPERGNQVTAQRATV